MTAEEALQDAIATAEMMAAAKKHEPEAAAWWQEKAERWASAALGLPQPDDEAGWERFAEDRCREAEAAGVDIAAIGEAAEHRALMRIDARVSDLECGVPR